MRDGSNDGFESTDLREVYGAILDTWMAVDPFPVLTADAGDPTRNWTAPKFALPLFAP
ncbi:MAG: hypothetical protein IT294_15015 [Deltaproteobacteria bacterium]|nr:hypothetical protein [Deltaproteobacteria bacterium]